MTQDVSWLIPVAHYASVQWLFDCVESIRAAWHPGACQIVLALDNYKASLPEMVTTVECTKTTPGIHDILNEGLKHCIHPIIARIDADDLVLSNRLKLQLPFVNHYDLVGGNMIVRFEDGRKKTPPIRAICKETLKNLTPCCIHGTWLFEKSRFFGYGQAYPWAEDLAYCAKLFARGGRMYNVDNPVIMRRQHGLSASAQNRGAQHEAALQCIKDLL